MSINLYKKFIEELKNQGIQIDKLTLKQISKSLELYKVIGGIN